MELNTIQVEQDRYLIYRPLLRQAFVGNAAMADLVAGRVSPAQFPAARDFLQQIGFDAPDPQPPPDPLLDFDPTGAVLLLTNQCQLRCTYCYAAAGENPARELSIELGQAAIDHVARVAQEQGRPDFRVSFHGGGEPAFAWKVLQACTAHARRQPLPARISLTSNGIWSPEMTHWIIANLDHVSLSMDGRPQTQDQQRPLVSGAGSAAIVMRTIEQLDRHQVPYGIRMTATAPWTDLPEDVRFICEQTGCPGMQVEPAFNTSRGGHVQPDEAECLAFADAYLAALEIATQAGRQLYYSGARLGKLTSSFCGAPYNALIVNAAGDLVTCYQIDCADHPLAGISSIGRIVDGQVQIDETARQRLFALFAERRAACRDCYCYWTCAGDCYTRTYQPGPQGHLVYSQRCTINRYLTQQQLLDQVARSGGVWRAREMFRTGNGS